MFGLERKKTEEEIFDLEQDIQDPAKFRELKTRVDARVQELKNILRSGSEQKEEFEQFGTLLHAYAALQKLMTRLSEQPKK